MMKAEVLGRFKLTPEQEIQFAAKLHYSFLPQDLNNDFLDISTINLPYRQIGGDYFSIIQLDDNNTVVSLCDVTGHSVTSALLAARISTYVSTHIEKDIEPCELIKGLNEYLCKRISNTGTFTCFGCLHISHEFNEIIFGGAALPPLLYFNSAKKQVELISSETIFLGAVHPLPVKCDTHTRKIASGDKIIICTDGIIESENQNKELWGIEPLIDIINKNHQLTSFQLNDSIMFSLNKHSNNTLNDDLTLISISIK